MVLKRAVILKIYHMPNSLTSKLYKKINQIFRDVGGRWKNDPRKILFKNFKQRPRKLKTGYSQNLVKQTVDMLGLKKIIVGFWLPTDPCRCLRLIKFYAWQKYKIKYCYSKSIRNLLTRKRVRLSAAANLAIVMCCLFVWDSLPRIRLPGPFVIVDLSLGPSPGKDRMYRVFIYKIKIRNSSLPTRFIAAPSPVLTAWRCLKF